MRKTLIFLWLITSLVMLLAACNPVNDSNLGTPSGSGVNPLPDSPRTEIEVPPTATSLPPTWTPVPTEQSEHLSSGGVSSSGVAYSGTRVIHVVQYGETLAQISNRYGASIADVARINNIQDWDRIEVGQVLTIPIPSE